MIAGIFFILAALALVGGTTAVADARLAQRALGGDGRAMKRLVDRLLPVIHARVGVFLSRRPTRRIGTLDQDDLVNEVWVKLIANDGRLLYAYDPQRGMSIEGYVGLITRRELWVHHEKSKAARRGGGAIDANVDDTHVSGTAASPDQVVVARDTLEQLIVHLRETLSPRGQLVLVALYEDGLNPAEVAQMLGVKTQVVYNWQHKIRKLARSFMEASG